jgi:ketosteroid isomerase-like protein
MKTAIRYLLPIALLLSGSVQADAPDAEELTQMLNDFLAGASVNDLEAHDRFWAEDLIYTSSSGQRFGKADIVDRNAPPDEEEADDEPEMVYSAEDIRIHQYGDTAIVAFRLVGEQVGAVGAMNFYNTGTFLRREGVWKVVAWQATRIPEEGAAE